MQKISPWTRRDNLGLKKHQELVQAANQIAVLVPPSGHNSIQTPSGTALQNTEPFLTDDIWFSISSIRPGAGSFYNLKTVYQQPNWNVNGNFSGNMVGTMSATENAVGVNYGEPCTGFHMLPAGTNVYGTTNGMGGTNTFYLGDIVGFCTVSNMSQAVVAFNVSSDVYRVKLVTNSFTQGTNTASATATYNATNDNGETVGTALDPTKSPGQNRPNGTITPATEGLVKFYSTNAYLVWTNEVWGTTNCM